MCAAVAAHDWLPIRADRPETRQEAEELSALLNAAPLVSSGDRDANFRSPASIQRKSYDLLTHLPDYTGKPTRGGRLDRQVLKAFLESTAGMMELARAIRYAIVAGELTESGVADSQDELPEEVSDYEGRLLLALHKRRERNPRLRREKLAAVASAGLSRTCEVCSFDFGFVYGALGDGYIEIHQVDLLQDSRRSKNLENFALLCANCHRILHRTRPWLTPSELRSKTRLASQSGVL